MALQGRLVTPKDLWWPLWYSHELWLPYKGFGGPTGGFGDPKGALVVAVVSPWGLVALQGGLVTPKEFWWPLWCPCEVWWPYRGFGVPTRELVALQGGLVTPKELWWSLWCPCEVWWPYKGVWWPYRGVW